MVSANSVRPLLDPFEIPITDDTINKLIVYLDLLLRWNQKINLTAIRSAEECITRHFGESFYLSQIIPLQGQLLDVGSGAGFPGLALKLLASDLDIVLLEPVGKKRAFLKEVIRTCGLDNVSVLSSRLEEFCQAGVASLFDIITIRAVGNLDSLIPTAVALLKPGGHLCLWVGGQQLSPVKARGRDLEWLNPVTIPLSDDRHILVGVLEANAPE